MPFERHSGELRAFLERHSVEGYHVDVPIFGPAVIEQQIPAREEMFFKVRAVKPVPFVEFANKLRYTDEQMTLTQWEEKYRGRSLSFLPAIIQDRLEAGETASQKDWMFQDLMDRGCMDEDQRVTCYSFKYGDVRIPPDKLKKGMLVDYVHGGRGYGMTAGWAGRIAGFEDDKNVVLLELLVPTPFIRLPDTTVTEKIRKGFYASKTAFMAYGLVQALELQGQPLPPGKKSDDDREYALDNMMDLAEIETFCAQHYPGEPHCFYHAMLMYIVPVKADEGTFHPLPEAIVDPEVVVEYE